MSRFCEGWRAAGMLLPLSSLPSAFGAGDLGPQAEAFARFLKRAGLHFWQILPANPTAPSLGNSPYSGFSAFAGWELYVSPELLAEDGLLGTADLRDLALPAGTRVDYPRALAAKREALDRAFARAEAGLLDDPGFQGFLAYNAGWLDDYALYMAAKGEFGGGSWITFPEDLRDRREDALRYWGTRLSRQILRCKFGQWLFFRQLSRLKSLLAEMGTGLIGDAAFYVSHDSADVWANRGLFRLDAQGMPAVAAGVPPDYYSEDGQLWGNPVYDWPCHRASGYGWWRRRLLHNLGLFDWTRLDHFRAFAACWAVPAGEATARGGSWLPGPGAELFAAASGGARLNIIAEDLGFITPDVTRLRRSLDFPGMRVLQFGAGDPAGLSIHCPFRIEPDNVCYTSTHDNNTCRGWYRRELDAGGRAALDTLAGFRISEATVARAMVAMAWMSPAAIAMTTVQDLLGLDERARLNVPSTASGNWEWRLPGPEALDARAAAELAELTAVAGRDNCEHPNILAY
ncbi:MAG: 4-alpha-glucanotransferase [Deltaproteobacteria bacterium]|nr:4-alpha-glucanotransferase [Deltaproteobacteria bacterium]